MSKLLTMLVLASVLAFLPSTRVSAQDKQEEAKPAATEGKAAKQERWEGIVALVSKDKSTLTVRQRSTGLEKIVQFDSSTKWTSQEHGSKKVNPIDASQVHESDRVICLGTWDKKGVLHASLISKRLTP